MVDNLGYRQNIIDVAKKLSGCHYLWGSAGASPGSQDGADYRPGSVTLARPSLEVRSPCLNAARCDASGSTYVCAGRWRNVPYGRKTDERDPDLIDFLSKFRAEGWHVYMLGYADAKRDYFLKLTPRKIVGENISVEDGGGQTVWGEDCRWIRHFDCIGFINYVLNETTSAPYDNAKNIHGWSNDIDGWVRNTQPVDMGEAPVPGDLLFRKNDKGGWGHIAFLSGDNTVVQAQDAAHGVHATERFPGNWHARGRLSSYFFQTQGVQTGPITTE